MTTRIEIRGERARAAAAEYIKQQLAQGKSLAKLLLETLDFENGEIVALSAIPLNPGEIAQYRQGHARVAGAKPQQVGIGEKTYAAYPVPSAQEQLGNVIRGCLDGEWNVCLLENHLAQTGDPWLARAKSRLLFHGSEVYHALFSVDRDMARVINAIREAERPPVFVGTVGRAPWSSGEDVASLHTVTAEQLADFAKTARCVFVRAYDGEGYLMWTRAD
jgi:hypothetical protein